MVRYRADAAQALHHHRHFPVGPALDEFLEAAEFDDVQADLVYLVVFVQQQRDLAVALDAGHRIDGHPAQVFWVWRRFPVQRSWHVSVVMQQSVIQARRRGRPAGR